ncbi:MAG: glycosyltransferase [Bacteroidaceae bacterium]|nr:glycosyltransferase [Bacteroidaceae bacterium]
MVEEVRISVITVCLNSEGSIEQTIQSVLGQTYGNIEYIIIDGASTDGTLDIISKYRDRLSVFLSEKDDGIYDAMNKGVAAATGDWIHFKNSGDTFVSPDTLKEVFSHPIPDDTQILHGNCIYTNRLGRLRQKPALASAVKSSTMPVLHPASFIRSDLHKAHPFDTSYKSCADYDFMLSRMEGGCRFHYIDQDIALFPIGGYAMRNFRLTALENHRILKSHGYQASVLSLSLQVIRGWLYSRIAMSSQSHGLPRWIYHHLLLRRGWRIESGAAGETTTSPFRS